MEDKVYIVSTPIGNLEDMTFRAIKVLKEVDVILCEDTRHSIKLLNHFEIKNKLISYHKFNEKERIDYILSLINENKTLALISDAGTPLISDPGNILVKELIENDIKFTVVPGANALLPALILSGFNSEEFLFIGFLPKKNNKKEEKLNTLKDFDKTLIFYSSPYELIDMIKAIDNVLGDRKTAISKEITKLHETTYRGTPKELIAMLNDMEIKGEFVIVVEGNKEEKKLLTKEEAKQIFDMEIQKGEHPKDLIKKLAKENNLNKRELYNYLMKK
ncbi:16S rRNA (cytidine(1402)-2'-O)-methyltransferase [Anaerofustis stercorihominis]|uniref:Ribosomal RNA small subunit methyltransferase I n=1 Tax=Anaerofustis stercorihominis DSM 17244 TaxID=445971 RepID=B1CBU7_9FIRM|nr:16S rRNA (cytidine(1402)-2'-O)-methyltransferase [Anaerofustis stercorihominis]EDS71744.1 S-adenosylmethionine-dependent methyltransferase, YraL family [Anaerofustis stercorihominis DSM 17244]